MLCLLVGRRLWCYEIEGRSSRRRSHVYGCYCTTDCRSDIRIYCCCRSDVQRGVLMLKSHGVACIVLDILTSLQVQYIRGKPKNLYSGILALSVYRATSKMRGEKKRRKEIVYLQPYFIRCLTTPDGTGRGQDMSLVHQKPHIPQLNLTITHTWHAELTGKTMHVSV